MAKNPDNWPAIGNSQAVSFLEKAIRGGKVSQAYVFAGLEDIGKSTIALEFARRLQGGQEGFNSDLHILEPEPGQKGIGIAAVREFIKALNLSSFSDSYKIGIIKEAASLSEESKNALLKTLEEPKDKVVIILLVTDERKLPTTILSRCQILYFYPVPAAQIYDYLIQSCGASRSLAKHLASLAGGRPLSAVQWLENPDRYQQYLDRAEKWLKLISLPVNSRIALLDQIYKDRTGSQLAREAAGEVIAMAEALARDLLLLSLDQPERVQHSALASSLERVRGELGSGSGFSQAWLGQLKIYAQAKEYLAANVNPRLVLEQVVMNL